MGGLPQPGQSFGRYEIVRKVGAGGMGVVYLATQRGLEREVALKILSAHLSEEDTYRNRFMREASTLARLDSQHVIHVYDAGEEDGWLYIATQYVPDGDLGQLIRAHGTGLPVAEALDLIGQVCDGISAAHKIGILHRDIKPANVLLRREDGDRWHAFVCDLGIAQVLAAEHTKTSGVIGTLGYMAPERHEGADASVASDVYALGCLLWATLTGSAPYAGTDVQVALGHMTKPVPQLPDDAAGAAALNPVLAKAMAKDPADRYITVDDLAAALREPLPVATTSEATISLEESAPEPTKVATVEATIRRAPAAVPPPAAPPARKPIFIPAPPSERPKQDSARRSRWWNIEVLPLRWRLATGSVFYIAVLFAALWDRHAFDNGVEIATAVWINSMWGALAVGTALFSRVPGAATVSSLSVMLVLYHGLPFSSVGVEWFIYLAYAMLDTLVLVRWLKSIPVWVALLAAWMQCVVAAVVVSHEIEAWVGWVTRDVLLIPIVGLGLVITVHLLAQRLMAPALEETAA